MSQQREEELQRLTGLSWKGTPHSRDVIEKAVLRVDPRKPGWRVSLRLLAMEYTEQFLAAPGLDLLVLEHPLVAAVAELARFTLAEAVPEEVARKVLREACGVLEDLYYADYGSLRDTMEKPRVAVTDHNRVLYVKLASEFSTKLTLLYDRVEGLFYFLPMP